MTSAAMKTRATHCRINAGSNAIRESLGPRLGSSSASRSRWRGGGGQTKPHVLRCVCEIALTERLTNPAAASPLLAQLFGYGVATAQLRGGANPALLYAEEAASCAGFAPKRIAEFAGGRLCARLALEQLGVANFPIRSNPDRTPAWPTGLAGSISHTNNFCCAAIGNASKVGSIGIDAEIIGGVTSDLDALLFTPREADLLAGLPDRAREIAATLIFSAKEAFYKCQYPVTRAWLDFTDATIVPETRDWASGGFIIETEYRRLGLEATIDLPLHGRFVVDDKLMLTGVALR